MSRAGRRDPRIVDVTVTRCEIEIDLDDGQQIRVPHTPRLKSATPRQRSRVEIVDDGAGVCWPDLDEDLRLAALVEEHLDAPLFRACRFCGERSRWNAERCESCGRERWNDPDDTELGRSLGELERVDLDAARAAEEYRRSVERITAKRSRRPSRDDT